MSYRSAVDAGITWPDKGTGMGGTSIHENEMIPDPLTEALLDTCMMKQLCQGGFVWVFLSHVVPTMATRMARLGM